MQNAVDGTTLLQLQAECELADMGIAGQNFRPHSKSLFYIAMSCNTQINAISFGSVTAINASKKVWILLHNRQNNVDVL